MPHMRSRLIAAPLAAAALTLTVAGYQAVAAGPAPSSGGAGTPQHATAGASASAPCLADASTLVGDLDGDGNPDRISNPGHNGTKMTIEWGTADGAFGAEHAVSDLLGAKEDEEATAAVADFDQDGTLDIVVNVVEPSGVDDPAPARIAEFRPGPLDRADLASPGAVTSDIGKMGEVQQLSVAQYNDDDHPDLAVRNNSGDGVTDRDVRLGTSDGLGEFDRETNDKYGESGTWGDPPAMPTDGWKQFYEPCS